jgi:hypothetical protein
VGMISSFGWEILVSGGEYNSNLLRCVLGRPGRRRA